MKLLNSIKNIIKKTDCFATTEFFRYKSESKHSTLFGGLVTILIFAILLLIFYYELLACISKTQTYSTEEDKISSIPTPAFISTFPNDNFMFAIQLYGNWTDRPKRFFDVNAFVVSHHGTDQFSLEQCTLAHWQTLPQIKSRYGQQLRNWLCFPLNSKFKLQGTNLRASEVSNFIEIQITKCTNTSMAQKPCATDEQIDLELQRKLVLTLYFVNPSINPQQPDYLTYYLDERNVMYFSKDMGIQGNLYVQDFVVETDESIFPMKSTKIQTGICISELMIPRPYETKYDDSYAQIFLYKSPRTKIFKRSFLKLFEVLALVGGLFSTITVFLFFVNAYSNAAFEISLGSALFKSQNQELSQNFKNYTFFTYLRQQVYNFFSSFGIGMRDWKQQIEYERCKKEMQSQLDVEYLLNRILYLETALSTLIEEHQEIALHFRQKESLLQAIERRKAFKLRKKMLSIEKHRNVSKDNSLADSQVKTPSNFGPRDISQIPKIYGECINLDSSVQMQQKVSSPVQRKGSDSESDDEESEKKSKRREILVKKLTKLKNEAERGNTISKRIWQVTNKTILDTLKQPQVHDQRIQLDSVSPVSIKDSKSEEHQKRQIIFLDGKELEACQRNQSQLKSQKSVKIYPKKIFNPTQI